MGFGYWSMTPSTASPAATSASSCTARAAPLAAPLGSIPRSKRALASERNPNRFADAAIPAGFIALVWPRLNDRRSWTIGLCAAAVALVLTPFLRPGVPVLLTSVVAVVAGVLAVRRKAES